MELSKRTPENRLKPKFAEHGPASVQKAYPSGAIMLPGGICGFYVRRWSLSRSVHKKALSVGPGPCVLRRILTRRSSQNSPSRTYGE